MDTLLITIIVNIILLSLAALCTLIYLVPIICTRRFHTTTNILTCNVCLTSILCCLYWIVFNVILGFYPLLLMPSTFSYIFSSYFQSVIVCLLVYSLATVTINRFLTILYPNKRFFKRQAWPYLSSSVQWVVSIILPIPFFIPYIQECRDATNLPHWIHIYTLLIVVILPSILNIIFNSLIYVSVRSSTRRVQALATTTNTTTTKLNHKNARDIYLLKHMVFIFVVFIIGWTPICILPLLSLDAKTNIQISQFLRILPVISALIIVLDLFYYNHDLRQYLKEKL